MKKNRTMRVATLLMALVLITSCFVGGTFAKYVTEGTATDSARVAKWGVTVKTDGSAFATSYTNDEDEVTVLSSNAEKVVAPGTSGTMANVVVSGTPEVAVDVTYEADMTLEGWSFKLGYYSYAGWKTPDGWNVAPGSPSTSTSYRGSLMQETQGNRRPETPPADPSVKQAVVVDTAVPSNAKVYVDGEWVKQDYTASKVYTWNPIDPNSTMNTNVIKAMYCPLVITVGEKAISGLDYSTIADFEAAVEAEIAACSAKYAAGTDLSAVSLPVTWAWAFESGNDAYDTTLGNMAANGSPSTIAMTIKATVTQID